LRISLENRFIARSTLPPRDPESTRREFLHQGTSGAALLGTLALPLDLLPSAPSEPNESLEFQESASLRWPSRITGEHKALFDVAEVATGFGVWRASAWAGQYSQVLSVPPAQLYPDIVLRHNAIILAMQQSFWDKYGVGKAAGDTHPLTGQPLDKNPVLADEKGRAAFLSRSPTPGCMPAASNLAAVRYQEPGIITAAMS
jgi:hypothetical protein